MRKLLSALLLVALLATPSWGKEIGGNYSRYGDPTNADHPTPYTLTEETHATGNFILCRVENVQSLYLSPGPETAPVLDQSDLGGEYDLYIYGSYHGLYVNGVKRGAYVLQVCESLAKADLILSRAKDKAGQLGVDAWIWSVVQLDDTPLDYQPLLDAWDTAAETNDPDLDGAPINSTDLDRAFRRIQQFAFGGASYSAIRTELLSYDDPVATWSGDRTECVEYE